MKEKEIRRIAKSVTGVQLVRSDAEKWQLHFSVSYQAEKEFLTSYYGDQLREWLDLNAAVKKVEELFPHLGEIRLFFYRGKPDAAVSIDGP